MERSIAHNFSEIGPRVPARTMHLLQFCDGGASNDLASNPMIKLTQWKNCKKEMQCYIFHLKLNLPTSLCLHKNLLIDAELKTKSEAVGARRSQDMIL